MNDEQYIKTNGRGDQFYYKDPEMTILHRTDGPAVIHNNDCVYCCEWWIEGILLRVGGKDHGEPEQFKTSWCFDEILEEDRCGKTWASKTFRSPRMNHPVVLNNSETLELQEAKAVVNGLAGELRGAAMAAAYPVVVQYFQDNPDAKKLPELEVRLKK